MFLNSRLAILILCSFFKVIVSSPEEDRYRVENLGDLVELLSLPINANPVIVGHYESFSAELREYVHYFYTSCAKFDVPEKTILNEYDRPIIKAVIDWSRSSSQENEAPIKEALLNGVKECEKNFLNAEDVGQRKMGGTYLPFGGVSELGIVPATSQVPPIPTKMNPTQSGETSTGASPTGPTPMRQGPTGPIPVGSVPASSTIPVPSSTYPTQSSGGFGSPVSVSRTPIQAAPSNPPPTEPSSMGPPPAAPVPETQPAKKKYIWDVDERLRRALPVRIAARLFVVETALQRLHQRPLNQPYLQSFHEYLINVVQSYVSSEKSTKDDAILHSKIYLVFTELTNWSGFRYRESDRIKKVYRGVETPEIDLLTNGYNNYAKGLPSSGLENFNRTWNILKKILVFPQDTDPVILGNLEFLPERALDLIHDLLHICFERGVPSDKFRALQAHLTTVIQRYKLDHNKQYLIESIYNLNYIYRLHFNYSSESTSVPKPIYDKIQKGVACHYDKAFPLRKELLDHAVELSNILAVITVLPPESCLRIAIFNACSKKIYSQDGKIFYESKIIDAIKNYADNRDEDYLRTAIIHVQHFMINQFEYEYAKAKLKTAPSVDPMNVDQPSSAQASQESASSLSIVPLVSPQSSTLFKERSSFKGKQASSRSGSHALFRVSPSTTFDDLFQEAVNTPRAVGGIRIEEPTEDIPIATPQPYAEQQRVEQQRAEQQRAEQPPRAQQIPVEPRESMTRGGRIYFELPIFAYSVILVVTLNLNPNARKSIREMYECFDNKKVAQDAKYLLADAQNRFSEAIWAYKNDPNGMEIHTALLNETAGCKKFVERNQNYRNSFGADFDLPTDFPRDPPGDGSGGSGSKRSSGDRPQASSEKETTGDPKRTRT